MKKKIITLIALTAITIATKAQQATPDNQTYGKIDQADLEMKACDFEKDANAEVLVNKAEMYYYGELVMGMDIHRRVKIFNDNGKKYANIVIPFDAADHLEYITDLEAETINLTDNKIEVINVDKKQIFTKKINRELSEIIFTFPNVRSGSVIDYKYTWNNNYFAHIPTWYYQENIPVRYCELTTKILEDFYFSTIVHGSLPVQYTKYEGSAMVVGTAFTTECVQRVMTNIPSLKEEPFMSSENDNLASIGFILTSINTSFGYNTTRSDTWPKIGEDLADEDDFGHQVRRKLTNEDEIITQAKSLKTDDEKIAFIFNKVKSTMKWNGEDEWFTNDGTKDAWDAKTGNSTEINLILVHLLKKSGVNAMPLMVSTREHGKVNPSLTFVRQFNRTVAYVPVDSTQNYILDASNKI